MTLTQRCVLLLMWQEDTQKAGVYVCWCVQSLVTLEQGGSISLSSLESQLETLLEGIVTFNPPGELHSLLYIILMPVVSSTIRPFFLFPFFYHYRDGFGREAHGILWPVQQRSGSVEWSGSLYGRGACRSCQHLAG